MRERGFHPHPRRRPLLRLRGERFGKLLFTGFFGKADIGKLGDIAAGGSFAFPGGYADAGSHFLGICGSATATLALVIPSFILVLLIVRFYTQFKSSVLFEGVMGWLRPTVVGLIGAAAIILIVKTTWFQGTPTFTVVEDNFPDWKSWCLLAAAFGASYWGKVNPILVIVAGAVLGLLIY